jgi:endo-1,4-beta-xylanase
METISNIDLGINENRKGDITIKTMPGSDVKIEQQRHEFLFGTAISDELAEKDRKAMSAENRKIFLKTLRDNFNYAVHENALKWYDTEIEQNKVSYYLADRIWELCNEVNIPMRGHCIFWDKDEYIMPWLKKLNTDELRAAVIRRAIDVTKHFRERINEFDLNNEMIHNDFFRRSLGYGILNEMAWAAKSGNPEATLFVNDYGILADGGFNADAYINQIDNLLASGVPIGGIGCQGHQATYSKTIMSAEHVQKTLDRLAKFNLPIKITECLFDADTEESQAEEMRKIFPIYFAHPGVEAILIWGFWAGAHWQPHTALWRKDWTITPQGQVYRDLVFNKWWTRESGKAGKDGIFIARAFFGEYLITSNGKTIKGFLSKKNKSLEINMDK